MGKGSVISFAIKLINEWLSPFAALITSLKYLQFTLILVQRIPSQYLTLSWRWALSYRNQSIDLQNKLMDWFLYDWDLRHERGKINRINGEKNCSYISAFYTLRMEWNLKSLCKIYCKYLVFTYQLFNRIKIEKNWCRFKAENGKWDSLVSAPFFSFIGFACTFYMHFYIVCTFCKTWFLRTRFLHFH